MYKFNTNVYDDIDIYTDIKKKYSLYHIKDYNIIHKIYLSQIHINKNNSIITKKKYKLHSIKDNFISNTSYWSLEDSCNTIKVKNKIKSTHYSFDTYMNLKYEIDVSLLVSSIFRNLKRWK